MLDALAMPAPRDVDGRSLLDAAAGGDLPDAPSYFESLSASLNRGWAPLYGIVNGNRKDIDLPFRSCTTSRRTHPSSAISIANRQEDVRT